MENPICDTAEDMEYKKAVREFFKVYNFLKKKRALRWSGHSDLKGAWIKILEHTNNGKTKTICLAKAETSAECYQMAADFLKNEQ